MHSRTQTVDSLLEAEIKNKQTNKNCEKMVQDIKVNKSEGRFSGNSGRLAVGTGSSQVHLSSAGIQLPVVCAKDLPNQDRPRVLLLVLESPVTGAAESSLPPFRGGRPLEVMETCFTVPRCLCSTHINHNEKQERLKLPLLYSYAFLFFPSHSSSSSSSTSQCVIA